MKVVSSYRDPAARGSVRIDVDMAEDVPNNVRIDNDGSGSRLTWSFRKGPSSAVMNGRDTAPEGASLPAGSA